MRPTPGEEGLMRRREAGTRERLSGLTFFKFLDFSLRDFIKMSDLAGEGEKAWWGEEEGEGDEAEDEELVLVLELLPGAAVFGFLRGLYL